LNDRAQFRLHAAGETETGFDHPRICMTAKKIATAPVSEPKTAKAATPAKAAKAEDTSKKAAKPTAKAAPKAAEPVAKGKPGRKPKVDEKAKKSEDNDVDLSDLEADLEGEPEVETASDETKVKAKPLRMKVSRAKERALMREFGLEETALTEEEAAKRRQELKTLIKMGKTRGFLTHQEINDHLPEKLVNDEILEAIVSMLNDMGIAVYEQAPDAATLLIAGRLRVRPHDRPGAHVHARDGHGRAADARRRNRDRQAHRRRAAGDDVRDQRVADHDRRDPELRQAHRLGRDEDLRSGRRLRLRRRGR
jgi:hypothetical protein